MKHVGLLFGALVCFVFAGVVVWYNRTALTTPLLLFAAGMVLFGFLLAAPANAKDAITTLAPFTARYFRRDGP